MLKTDERKKAAILLGFSFLALCFLLFRIPIAESAEAVGKFTIVQGRVDILREGNLPAIPAEKSDPVFVKDIIRTKSDSRAEVTFRDGNILRIDQRSRIDISEYFTEEGRNKGVVKLTRGKVEAIVEKSIVRRISISPEANRFEIHTPNAVAGVRGTDLFVFYFNNMTVVLSSDGVGYVYNLEAPEVVRVVPAGYMTTVLGRNLPLLPTLATGADAKTVMQLVTKEPKVGDPTTPGQVDNALNDIFQSQSGNQSLIAFAVLTGTPQTMTNLPASIPLTEGNPGILVPVVEVGRTNLSGALIAGPQNFDYVSVLMKDVVFLAPSTGQRPSIWGTDKNTGSVTGSYSFGQYINSGNITSSSNAVPLSDGHGLSADFQFSQWNASTNKWEAVIQNGTGSIKNGGPNVQNLSFSGAGSGTITPANGNKGTLSGAANGVVSK
jgi:hypothetical protein